MIKSYAEIYIIDLNTLEQLGEISEYKGITFTETFIGCGKFELYAPITPNNVYLLKDDNMVYLDENHCGIISSTDTVINDSGEKVLKVSGYTMEILLARRIIWGTFSATNSRPDQMVFDIIDQNCITPSDQKRVIPFLGLGYIDLSYNLAKISHQKTGGEVYEDCKTLCTTYNIGLSISVDLKNKQFLVNIRYGINRSVNQTDNEYVLFSTEMQDITSSEYTKDSKEFKTTALVSGEGEGSVRTSVIVGDNNLTGFSRREMYIDARDLQSENTDDPIETVLASRGLEKLSEKIIRESFSNTLRPDSTSYQYGKDYFLGDTITAEDCELGVQVDVVITEMTYEWDGDKFSFSPTLGYKSLKLIDKVKSMIK